MQEQTAKKGGLRVKYKLLLAIYCTITPLVLVVSLYIYYSNYHAVLDGAMDLYANLVEVAGENIGYLNGDIYDMSTYIGVNTSVRSLLAMDREELDAIPWPGSATRPWVSCGICCR